MKNKLEAILNQLRQCQTDLSSKKITAGFDGFVDSIQKVVFNHPENQQTEYFKTIGDFGQYISAKKSGGLSLETEETVKKIGGNVPIMANAVAQFGVGANCIGAFGYPNIDPVFSGMHQNTSLFSFADPGITSALEFSDGKIMLAQMTALNEATWELIKEYVGLEQIIKMFDGSDMICLLNWSEVRHTNEIWKGIIREVFPLMNWQHRKKVLFDLSDCSKHGSNHIKQALEIIKEFSNYCDVTLSLNRNEAMLVHKALNLVPHNSLDILGVSIYKFLNIDTLVIHTSTVSWVWKNAMMFQSDAFVLKNHRISTGAGDNFNAGLCIAQLIGLEPEDILFFANMVAACYMFNGKSPGMAELESFTKSC